MAVKGYHFQTHKGNIFINRTHTLFLSNTRLLFFGGGHNEMMLGVERNSSDRCIIKHVD